MAKDVELESRSITEQAAEWFVRCAQGELTVQEREALQHWLRAAPDHAAALAEILILDAQFLPCLQLPRWTM